jgi:hypothetical protein
LKISHGSTISSTEYKRENEGIAITTKNSAGKHVQIISSFDS